MSALIPVIKDWIEDTDWLLDEVFYYYRGNPKPVNAIGAPMQMYEGQIEEGVSITMQAPGMHDVGPIVPDQFPNPAGAGSIVVTSKRLEFEAESLDFGQGRPSISTNHGVTTFKVKAVVVT